MFITIEYLYIYTKKNFYESLVMEKIFLTKLIFFNIFDKENTKFTSTEKNMTLNSADV